jgi:NADPH:quinone reductase
MKALLCSHYGTPDDLELADIADPTPGPGEAVVRVEAAALNFFDTLIIAGKYQTKPTMPFSPAAEFAGIVENLGAGVSDFKPGDRVLGYSGRLVKLPDGLDFDRAAGLCVTYGTTLHALKDRARLKSGETLAVLGASGGTGLAGVELGKLMGARVIACASSVEKTAFAREHGADDGIDYGKDDLKEALRRVTQGRGADVIYDPVGGAYSWRSISCCSKAATYSACSGAHGSSAIPPVTAPIPNNCWHGQRRENCRRMCTRSIRWRKHRPHSKPSPRAR